MADNVLGLLFEISADPTKAQEAISRFEDSTQVSLKKAAQGFKDTKDSADETDKSILNATQSTRLLASELGVHLPRQVSSAIAQMLPGIAGFGGALLGIFAVERVVEWGEKAVQAIHDAYIQADEAVVNLDAAATAAFKHAKEEAASLLTAFKTSTAGQLEIAEIDARMNTLLRYHKAYQEWAAAGENDVRALASLSAQSIKAIADAKKEDLYSLAEVEQRINEVGQLQFAARKQMRSVEEREAKEAEAAAKRAAEEQRRQLEELNRFNQELLRERVAGEKRWQAELEKDQAELGRLKEQVDRALGLGTHRAPQAPAELFNSLVGGFRQLSETARALLPISDQVDDRLLQQAQRIREVRVEIESQMLPTFRRIDLEYQRQRDEIDRLIVKQREEYQNHKITLAQMEADEQAYTQAMVDLERERTEAKQQEASAVITTMGAEIGTFVGAIAGRKAEAEVEGGFYLAAGAFDLARAIWPPNPQLIARGLGEIGAGINMLKVAGESGRAPAGAYAGGGAGSYESAGTYGLRPGPLAPGTTGTATPMTPPVTSMGGPTISGNVRIMVMPDSSAGQEVARVLNHYVTRQGGQLIASRAVLPPKAGR